MFSKEEAKQIRQEFWTSFGKEYPNKWILYNTGLKEIQLKFSFERKFAMVSLDVYAADDLIQAYYFEKLESLKSILKEDYLPEVIFDADYELPEGKSISRVYVILPEVSIYNKKTWPQVKDFLATHMSQLEDFFREFRDFIRS